MSTPPVRVAIPSSITPGWVSEACDGTVAVPDVPGLGIELDGDKLAHYTREFFEVTSRGLVLKTIREKGLFTAPRLAREGRQ